MKTQRAHTTITRFWPYLLFAGITVLLWLTNLNPGHYLLGWDSLQTDLNPGLGVKRAFFSVWEEYQSFGLTAGMAHAADLPRALVIYAMSIFVPQTMIRYSFHVLMGLIASCGMYHLLRLLDKKQHRPIFAVVGALFYILNFSVIQTLFLPFEAFSIFFGFLPWLIWSFMRMFRTNILKRRDLLIFALINIAAIPSFVAQQLFVVYFLTLGLLWIGLVIRVRKIVHLKKFLALVLLIVGLNSFWLVPQAYFLTTNGSVVREAKINQIATDDVLFANKDKGNLSDFLSYNGFFYDRVDMNKDPLFSEWKHYRENPIVIGIIITMAVVVLLGILRKSSYRSSFIALYALVALALLSNTLPFNWINDLIRNNAFVNQVFRSPFTKFGILYAFVSAYFFYQGLLLLSETIRKKSRSILPALLGGVLVVFLAFPVFQGQLFAKQMQVAIPDEYLHLFTYFEHIDKNKRIALLPEYTFWGWYYTKWGYDGSGFLWYGIEQPIISRNFDYWSNKSESYFWELKDALESGGKDELDAVLKKYDVDYIIFDTSLLPIVSSTKAIQYTSTEELLQNNPSLTLVWSEGSLRVYKTSQSNNEQAFVYGKSNLENTGPLVKTMSKDRAFQTIGDYKTEDTTTPDNFFPFLDLTSQNTMESTTWSITEEKDALVLTRKLPFTPLDRYKISAPTFTSFSLYRAGNAIKYILPITTSVSGDTIRVIVPKILAFSAQISQADVTNCAGDMDNIMEEKTSSVMTVTTSNGAIACFQYDAPNLSQEYGYLTKIQSANTEGQNLFFYALDLTKQQAAVEDRISKNTAYYILNPKSSEGQGYAFAFQNTSYNTIPSANTLSSLTTFLFPVDAIRSIVLTRKNAPQVSPKSLEIHSQKTTYYQYEVTIPHGEKNTTLILDQAFQKGWAAYAIQTDNSGIKSFVNHYLPFLSGRQIQHHVMINNWANGWAITPEDCQTSDGSCQITLLYLPQYFEYLGLITIALVIFGLIVVKPSSKLDKIRTKKYNKSTLNPLPYRHIS